MQHIGIDIRKLDDFGIGTYIRTLLRAAAEMTDAYRFTALHKPGDDLSGLPPEITTTPDGTGLYTLSEPFRLARTMARHEIDLLHCPHYVTPMLTRRPVAVTIHDLIHLRFPELLPGALARRYARYFIGRAVKKASVLFTVSEFSKADILRQYDRDPDSILVTHNVINTQEFEDAGSDDDAVLQNVDLPEKFLLYTGNNKPHKDLPTAVRAFASFRKRAGNDWHLCFAGGTFSDSKAGAALLRLVEELQIADAVTFLGYLPRKQLLAVLRRASIFVFPSRYEGFGLPPLEAMAAGVPVVASNAPSLPEVLGDAALFAEPGDVAIFADNMERIAADRELAERLIKAGKKNVERFSYSAFKATLERGYQTGLDNG